MQGAIALSPETQELLRSKPSKLTQLTQEQIDILKNWPEASRDLYHASQNAKRLLDDANLDDTLAWNAAEALKNIYIDATGNDIYRGREWRNFNEANQDFANGREALQRFYDIVSGTAKGDPRDPKVQAAALIGEENRAIMQEMAAWEKSYIESLAEKQSNLEAQYRNDQGFFAELDEYAREKKIQETAQENIDLDVQLARRRWLTEKAKQMGFYPDKVENDPYYDQLVADEDEAREAAKYARAIDPRQPYQRLVPAIPKEVLEAAKAAKRRKDYEPIAKDNIAYNALMTRLAQNAAFSQFVEIADTLNQSERELILRAFDAGKEGIDINSHEGGKTWEELGLPEPENRAVADILGGRDAHYQTLPNVALASNIDPAHEETVRNLISLARGRVEDPQFFTDLWNRLAASTDRTLGNVPRFIDAMAKDLTVGAYNYFADEDLYANYTAQARAEAIKEAKWDAATAPLYYEPGYGWFGEGIIGITEQLPIWGVLAAGGAVSYFSAGTIPGVQAAMGVLALGYAEDTRQQLLIDGADPLTALVAGATSGVVQSWLERAQAETLIGKGWSGNLLAVASRDIRGTVANAFYKRTLKEFGTWQFAQAAFRFGGGMAISGFQEAVQEGLQAGADRFISDLALKDPSFERALKASVDEFVATLPTMMMTAGLGGTVRVTSDVSRGASVGKQLRILTGQGIVGKKAEEALTSIGKTMDVAGLREAWRNASSDRARIKLLMDVGHLAKTQATALHAYLIAEEKIADRHDALALEMMIDMSNEGAKTFANNPEAIRRVMTAIGLRNVQVEAAAIGSLNADNSKNERDGWRVTADVGNGRTVTFTIGVMTEQESALDGSAATASSAWEYLQGTEATQKEIKGMTQAQFTERWMSDEAWRKALINTYGMARRGESLILRKDSPYIVAEYNTPDGKTRKRKVSAAGAILIATGDHGRRVKAENKTLAHETVHAIVGLLRDTGVLTPETVKALREEYGDPAHGVDELFNEEVFADALMTEAGYGLEMLERAAGEATRRKQNAVAHALRGIADLFMGGGDFVLSRGAEGNITGLTISENADRGAPLARYRNRAVLNSLRTLAQQAADIYNATERARSLERLGRIRQGIHERIAKRREEAAKQAETEAERQQRDDELMACVDSDLSQMAEEAFALAQTELNATRVDIEKAAADIREAFNGYDPKADNEASKVQLKKGQALVSHWRTLKNRELELMRELADLNIDPSARREYLIAREKEAHRLQGRAAREALDAEKRRIKETPVAEGDTLLANTRAIGHVTIESRESYIKRKMAEHGWDRKTAIAQATHLYPEDMEDLRAPWANRNLYTGKDGHSPDTAAQALYDDGRIADPTVDAFWDAVRGDIEVVAKAKKREIEAAEAEAASVLAWGKERHMQTLAAIEMQDETTGLGMGQERSSIGGRGRGYIGNRWSVNAQNAMDRGMRTEAQVAQSLGISYMAWMHNRPFSGNGADNIIGVRDENGRDIYVGDLLDLSHEWHHVGKNYDEVTFVDPDEFYDVKSAGDIADKQDAGLFWLYTRMREYPRQIDRNKLSREEADQALAIEHEMASRWEESVKPSRDAFVRAIAADADVDTLRALGDAFKKAMHEHKLAEDERTKAFLGQIGKPNAYLNKRPRRNSGVRSSIGGLGLSERARDEMDEVRRQYEGTDQWMKAPNGQPTKLTRRQWLQVRTPSFKAWFGDWENDPANASKVVDENGEPLVVYHGSENAGFTVFDSDYWDEDTIGNFASSEEEIAGTYSGTSLLIRSDMGQGKRQGNYALFLNIRNPLIVDAQGNYWDEIPPENIDDYVGAGELTDEQLETLAERAGVDEELERDEDGELTWQGRNDLVESVESAYAQDVYDSDGWPTGETESPIFNSETLEATSEHRIADSTRKIANRALEDGTGYDGVIFRDIVDIGPHSRPFFRRESDVFVTKEGVQLKSATDNVGTFSPENPDIRYSIGGLFTGARVPYARADLRFVGTGERSQVYGWGLYASAVRDIAQNTYGMGFVEDGLHRITRSYSGNPHGGEREYATFFAVLRDLMVSEKKYKTDASTIPLIEEARQAIIAAKKDEIAHGNVSRERLWFLQDQIEAMEELDPEKVIIELDPNTPAVHEQVWWTHRPEGDESHLLDWFNPIRNELRETILEQARKEKLKLAIPEGREGYNIYYDVATAIRARGAVFAEKEASEFLYRAGVDGIKYPADAHLNPQNKDGNRGWNYVAFSDEHLQVVRRWIWDEATQAFVLDRSFTPPPPTEAEARAAVGNDQAIAEDNARAARAQEGQARSSVVGRLGAGRIAGTAHATRSLEEAERAFDAIIQRHVATLPNDVRWEALPEDIREPIIRMTQPLPGAPKDEAKARAIWRSLTLTAALLAEGRSHSDLLRELGWTLGPDGLPRAELQPGTLTEKAKRAIETTKTSGRGRSITLGAFLDDPALFAAYPELRDLKVRIKTTGKLRKGVLGEASFEKGEIALLAASEQEILDSVYHETQHIIQNLEGFAPGDDASTGMDAYSRSMGEVEARAAGARATGEPGPYESAVTIPRTEMLTGGEAFIAHMTEALSPGDVYEADWVKAARDLLGFPERFGDRRVEYNGGTDWTYETFDDGIRTYYAEYRDDGSGPRGVHGREEYVDEENKRKVVKYYDHGREVDHPVVNERIVPGQGREARSSIGGVNPAETSARQKDAHGVYPDASEDIARASIGGRRQAEYRAIITKHRPNLPQEEVDRFMDELGKLGAPKAEKAALHWFVRGALELPEDKEKLKQTLAMAERFKLDPLQFDSPAALAEEAERRNPKKQKVGYIDPDTVQELTNKRDLGNGLVIYDVEDSEAGQAAMRRIMNSHLGRNANGEYWSPWCLLTPTVSGGVSESAKKYWGDYDTSGRGAAFYKGKLVSFQSSKFPQGPEWWDMNDKSHRQWVPYTETVSAHEVGWDDVPAEAVVMVTKEANQETGEHRGDGEIPVRATVGDKQNGLWQLWVLGPVSHYLREQATYKDGKLDGQRVQYHQTPGPRSKTYLEQYELYKDGEVAEFAYFTEDGATISRKHEVGGRTVYVKYWRGKPEAVSIDLDKDTIEEMAVDYDGLMSYVVTKTQKKALREDWRLGTTNGGNLRVKSYVDIALMDDGDYSSLRIFQDGHIESPKGITSLDALKESAREHGIPLTQRTLDRLDAFQRGDLEALRVKDPFAGVPLPDVSAYEQDANAAPGARSSIAGVGRGARAAGLYFGRSPTQADIASRAIIEAGLFATGRKQSANKVIEAYRDIGVTISPEDAAEVADRINANLEEQETARARRVKPGEEPRDKVFTLDAILAQAYDENWKKAEKEAFAKGVSGTFGAAREMAKDVQEAMEARRKEAEAVTGTAPAIIETEMGFDIEASLLAAPEQIKTKVEIGKQQKQTEEERKAALEEAKREDEATGPDGIAPEQTLEQMGFTESKLDELQKRRRELRDRLAKLEREREEKRKEAKKKYQEKKDEAQNAKQEEDNYLEYCENIRVALNGIAFDLDNPPSVREFVNLMILHVAERRAGHEIKHLRELREALADPLVVRDAARTLAQIAEDLANRLVPSAARELIVKKAMTLAAAETIGQVRALATGALLSIRNVRIRQGRTELRDAMVKMIQSVKGRGRTVVGKEDSERKVSGDLERWLEDIEKALTLGEAALESMRTAAYTTIAGLSEHGKTQKELVEFRDYMKAMRIISAIDKFGAWRHKTLAELDDLQVELERMINGGLEAHERKMRQMEAKIDGFVQPLIDAMTQHAPDFKPDENAPLRERVANFLDRHLGLQSLLFEALLGKSTGETRLKAQRAVRDLLNEFATASAKYEATLLAWRAEIQDIIIRNYKSTRAFMERMHTPVPEDLRAHLTNRRTDAQEQAGREARQKTRITYGQALQLYASLVQKDYAQNARIHHRDGADFDALRRNLSDADVAFIAECSRFMKRIFPDLQAEYAEVTGITVGTTPNYWPVKIDYPRSGLPAEVRAWTPIVAAMEPRRRNGLDFKEEVSAEQMLFGRLDEWARMLAYGKLGIISAAVFGNGDVINAITNALGTKMALRIQENIKTALMGPPTKADNAIILSTRWASAFAMSGNIGVAFKQFAGIPAFALKLGARDTIAAWWGGVTRLADDAWDADWAILTASDAYKARYGGAGLNAEMRAALQGATPGAVGGATAKAYDIGFRLQSIADRAVAKPFAIAAFRKYREAYLREGLPAEEAQRRAVIDAWALVEDTQQGARPENQLQSVNTSRIVRMLTQFRSAPLQQLQWEMRAWAAFLRGEEGAKQKLARVIFINHVLTPLFWTAFDVLWQGALGLFGPGDEDDEEKMEQRRDRRLAQWVGELALGAILGQLTAVPVLGGAVEATYSTIAQNIRRKAEGKDQRAMTTTELATAATDVPAIRSAADIAATVYNVGLAATEVEMRDVASEADDFLKTAVPLYRDASKGAEQWGLGDLDNLWEEEE